MTKAKARAPGTLPIFTVVTLLCFFTLGPGASAFAANLPSEWKQEQTFAISNTGLVKISLPVETLAVARPGLEDLRLYDDAGNAVPYVIDQAAPVPPSAQPPKSFQVSLNADTTVITLATGVTQPLNGVTLQTPAQNFLKAVRVESSPDGAHWQSLLQGQPIFRQPGGVEHLLIALPAGVFDYLRITVDDRRSAPIPFTGAQILAGAGSPAPGEWVPAAITGRDENPGETRLTLDLGAANVTIGTVKIETGEPLLMRPVTLAIPILAENYAWEKTIARGSIYRIATEGQPASENLSVPVRMPVPSREVFLYIKNGDNPPLPVSAVQVERRPVWLVFLARSTGVFHLLSGNSSGPAPNYDLTTLNLSLKSIAVTPVKLTPAAANPNYHPPEVLPGLATTGAALDVSAWEFRKPVKITSAGAQQLEPDLDVLAHAQRDLADARVMHGSNQAPYIIQRTTITRTLTPIVTATNDSHDPKASRWIIRLPKAHLPVTQLTCVPQTLLFERSLSLYEELTDERGDRYRQNLGDGEWRQTPGHPEKELSLTLNNDIQGDTLILETRNGDNAPIELGSFTVAYTVNRLLFKAQPGDELFLYYGNPQASPPSYDLNLLADQLLVADKKTATLAGEEQLKKSSWHETPLPGQGGVLLWGALALVVVVLLVVISKLLPKEQVKP